VDVDRHQSAREHRSSSTVRIAFDSLMRLCGRTILVVIVFLTSSTMLEPGSRRIVQFFVFRIGTIHIWNESRTSRFRSKSHPLNHPGSVRSARCPCGAYAPCKSNIHRVVCFDLCAYSVSDNSIFTMRPPSRAFIALTVPPYIRTMRSVIARPSPAPLVGPPLVAGIR
jgi:hypothetical protein